MEAFCPRPIDALSNGNLRVTARSLVPLMDVLTEQLDSSVQLPVSDATRERRDPLTLGLLPEAERCVCEAVGPGPPALAGGPPLFARGLRHRCVPHRRGAYRARDGPRPSAEGARHCPSGHGGKGEATL